MLNYYYFQLEYKTLYSYNIYLDSIMSIEGTIFYQTNNLEGLNSYTQSELVLTEINLSIDDLDNRVTNNTTDISNNKILIFNNTTDIGSNKISIANNTTDISNNKILIANNTTDISNNKILIANNTTDISNNKISISNNTTDISSNKISIANNTTDISNNKISISNINNILTDISYSENITTINNNLKIVNNSVYDPQLEIQNTSSGREIITRILSGAIADSYNPIVEANDTILYNFNSLVENGGTGICLTFWDASSAGVRVGKTQTDIFGNLNMNNKTITNCGTINGFDISGMKYNIDWCIGGINYMWNQLSYIYYADRTTTINNTLDMCGNIIINCPTISNIQTDISNNSISTLLSRSNAWTNTNTYNTTLPTSSLTATGDTQFMTRGATKAYCKTLNNYNTTIYIVDDFLNGKDGEGFCKWNPSGGGNNDILESELNHLGMIRLGTLENSSSLQNTLFKLLFGNIETFECVFRVGNPNNNYSVNLGFSTDDNTYTNSIMMRIKKVSGNSKFVGLVNGTEYAYLDGAGVGNFNDNWFYVKITNTGSGNASFYAKNLNTSENDTFFYTGGAIATSSPLVINLQIINDSFDFKTLDLDYVSVGYNCGTRN